MRMLRLVGGLAVVVVVSACSSAGSWSAAVPGGASGTVAPTTTAAQPTATPSASSPAPAADGTDVAACRDGTCEVLIRGRVVVPLDPRFGFAAMTVTFVPPDRTLFSATDPQGGTFSGGIGGLGQIGANGITVRAIEIGPAGVVLRFAPRS